MKNVFKKAVSLTVALSTVAALSVSAFAATATYDKTGIAVSVTDYTITGTGQYAVAVVPSDFTGDDADIYYVNQADQDTIDDIIANMLVKGELADGDYEVRIGNNAGQVNADGEAIEVIPFTVSTTATKDYITTTVEGKATVTTKSINTAAKAAWWTSSADADGAKVFDRGSAKIKLVLDKATYPTEDGSTYNVAVVDTNGNAVANAEVYYSADLDFYVALIPAAAVTAGYQFEVTKAANTATVLGVFGEVNGRAPVNLIDAGRVAAIYNKKADNTLLTTNATVIGADTNNDGNINLIDAGQIASKYNKKIDSYTIEQ